MRPISPFVDITNYVLLELGHPMHAFDLDRLAGADIRVRARAPGRNGHHAGRTSAQARRRDAGDRRCASAQAIAGVMGGATPRCRRATRRIAFESAYFKPASVRRTSKRLGLKTEASSRFERGTDINAPVVALRRAVALMQQIGAGALRRRGRRSRTRTARAAHAASAARAACDACSGSRCLTPTSSASCDRCSWQSTPTADGWDVTAPTLRVDLLREVDLIEEVGRHYGFDRLDAAVPGDDPGGCSAGSADRPRSADAARVAAAGLSEAVTFGFIERRTAEAFAGRKRSGARSSRSRIRCRRSSTCSARHCCRDWSIRSRTIAGTGGATSALYEIGSRFTAATGETPRRGVRVDRRSTPEHWSGGDAAVDFFDAKGVVELVCARARRGAGVRAGRWPWLVAGQSAPVGSAARRWASSVS